MAKRKKKQKKQSVITLVRKSNDLVEAKYKFDIWETRIFTKMLTMIRFNDEDFKDYRIYLRDIVEEYDLQKNKESYEWLKRGARKLMTKIIRVVRDSDEGLKEFYTPIVVGVENSLKAVEGDQAFIDVSFHPKMKPFLLVLQSKYTTYDVRNILKLPSAYSIRIYELLKQYEKISRRKFPVQELKEIIGVIEEIEENGKKKYIDNYPLYGNFRQRVLLKAQKDIAKYTDIRFEFEPVKKGRKIAEILFHIYPNSTEVTNKKTREKPPQEHSPNGYYPRIAKWVGEETYKKWQQNYSEEQINTAIRYTLAKLQKGERIENVGGYIFALVKQTNLFDPAVATKEKQLEKVKIKKQAKMLKADLEARQRQLYQELQHKEISIMEALFIEQANLKEEIFEEIKHNRFSAYNRNKSKAENFENPIFYAAFKNKLKERFAARFKSLEEQYLPEINKLKIDILNL